jgi:pre-rRNA-processing protein TSR1
MAPSVARSGAADTDWDVSSNMTMEAPNAEAIAVERKQRHLLVERSQEDLEFPDEVDTPLDVAARERFQKFRGLKSFRTSAWDPYEELPVEYSRIWEFEAFGSTSNAVKQQYADDCNELGGGDGGGCSALYCALYLKDVPPTVFESQMCGTPFVLSGLFPCEQKVSVVHGELARLKECIIPIKSKQLVTLHCGFRRFPAKPTFSEVPKKSSACKKFRYMRFLHEDVTACASFYAPVIFPPCRLLMFVHSSEMGGSPELAAVGSVTGVDPKRLVIKRSMLTGYPFKTHKSKAVVRFMFFNPPDVRWFKPVELSTKKGLRGHILDSVGTHGYMKCRFNDTVKQDDTVCMNLYKRVYPKWYPPSWGGREEDGPEAA